MSTASRSSDPGILAHLIALFLDYLRWTQLTPMLFAWSGAIFMLLGMAFVLNLETSETLTMQVSAYLMESPRLVAFLEWLDQALGIDSADREITDVIWDWFLAFWSGAAFVLFLLGQLARAVGLGLPVLALRTRMKIALGLVVLLGLSYFLLLASRPEIVHGSPASWAPFYVGLPVVVFLVSAWGIWASFWLRLLADGVLMAKRA